MIESCGKRLDRIRNAADRTRIATEPFGSILIELIGKPGIVEDHGQRQDPRAETGQAEADPERRPREGRVRSRASSHERECQRGRNGGPRHPGPTDIA